MRRDVRRELMLDDREGLAGGDAAVVFVDERVEGVVERELRADAEVATIVGAAEREAVFGGLAGPELIDGDARVLREDGAC